MFIKKNQLNYLLLIFTCFGNIYGDLNNKNFLLEANAAYVFPLGKDFEKIYSNAGYYRIEGTANCVKYVKPWTSVGLIYSSGTSLSQKHNTEIYMIPLDIGLKFIYPLDIYYPYISGGIDINWTIINNEYPYAQKRVNSLNIGATGKIGLFINPNSSAFFIDIFGEYTWLEGRFPKPPINLNLTTKKADLSRISVGGGIGYSF